MPLGYSSHTAVLPVYTYCQCYLDATLTYTLRESLLVIHSNELTSNRQMGRE